MTPESLRLEPRDVQLAHALQAWRTHPCGSLSRVICVLSDLCFPEREFLSPRSKVAFQTAWMDLAVAPDPVEIGWLCDTLTRLVPLDDSVDVVESASACERFPVRKRRSPESSGGRTCMAWASRSPVDA